MVRREADIVLAAVCSLALVSVEAVAAPPALARVALGIPFVLVLPGYALAAAIFPRRGDLDLSERLALSVGLSMAIVPLLGLALNYSPWGIRPDPVIATVTLFTLLMAALALLRRRLLPPGQATSLAVPWRRWPPADGLTATLAAAAVALIAALAVGGAYILTVPAGGEAYTEFYVLSPSGRAGAYPSSLALGQRARLVLGLANHEGRDTTYRMIAKIDGAVAGGVPALMVEDGGKWERGVDVFPTRAGDGQKVEYLLYREGGSEPYRRLHLWLDVQDRSTVAVADVSPAAVAGAMSAPEPAAPEPEAPAAPQPEPAASGPPPPTVHVVSPGEYLTLIASRHGVTLSELLALNDIDNPNLIHPDQRINLPSVDAGSGE